MPHETSSSSDAAGAGFGAATTSVPVCVAGSAVELMTATDAPPSQTLGVDKCASTQFKGAGKYAQGILKAESKNLKKPDATKLAADKAKALAKLQADFVKAVNLGCNGSATVADFT